MVPAKVHKPVIADGPGRVEGAEGGRGTARRRVPAADGVTS